MNQGADTAKLRLEELVANYADYDDDAAFVDAIFDTIREPSEDVMSAVPLYEINPYGTWTHMVDAMRDGA